MTTPTRSEQPLLRELIDIPVRIDTGDFVLKLTEGLRRIEATLDSYVITPQLKVAFGEALGLIGSSLAEGQSKASYLHGSFGSGKSHFMAVLHALLRGDVRARSKPEFADALATHPWLGERRFLMVPYHLIGAESLEAAILGKYVEHVRNMHPDAPLPPVYRAQGLLADARTIRDRIGAEAFRAQLATASDDEWGTVETAWTEAEIEEAFAAPPDSDQAWKLISDVIPVFMPGYVDALVGAANAFVPLDQGLAAISRHAKSLGYDAVVLFLDELVLWLVGKIGNPDFVSRETEKVAKLVESSDASRAVPIISFIARQRDLRELIGRDRTGAEALSFQDQLSYWDGRFGTIDLQDRNLELIAEKRILKPVDDKAAERITEAFRRTDNLPGATRDVLLTSGDGEAFRRTYPFSPAFMQTLVHVSSALQRERTALRLMQQILVERRDDLRLGQLVPLGDLFDAIADGSDQPFTEKLKHEFEQARTLYRRTLRPLLLEQRGLTEEQATGLADAQPALVRAFRADDRLAKTLLLAALAPDVGALRGMTARRLAALNHGTIQSMIPGQEVAEVVRRLRAWASRVPELKVGTEDEPSVRLQLVGVDTGAILELVAHVDNEAAHRRMFRELLLAELGVSDDGAFELEHTSVWRGSRRTVEIVYGNVRDRGELRDEVFQPSQDGRWRVVLDYPFDSAQFSAAEDRNRLRELPTARCVSWLPGFVTQSVRAKVGTLVRIEHLLSGNRLAEAATRLGPDDRERARDLLRNQGENLRVELRMVLKQAYGLARPDADNVLDWSDHLISLDPALTPKLDVGRSFADALGSLIDQCFTATYPEHPQLDPQRRGQPVSAAEVRTVLAVVRRAVDAEGGRLDDTDRSERPALQKLAHPLRLGEYHGGPFTLTRHWETEFERRAAQTPGDDLSVRVVRGWLADLGLETRVENLVIACFAELSRRAWVRAQQLVEPPASVDEVRDDMLLRRQAMPEADTWRDAVERAGALFGVAADARVITPRALARFVRLRERVEQLRGPAADLVEVLEQQLPRLGVDPAGNPARLRTARLGDRLLTALRRADGPVALVEALAGAQVDVPLVTLGKSLSSASQVADVIRHADWQVLDQLAALDQPGADQVRETLRTGAALNEDASALRTVLATAKEQALKLMFRAPPPPAPPPILPPGEVEPPGAVTTVRGSREEIIDRLREDLPAGRQVEVSYRILGDGDR